ncbi:MAG: hypothetical protein JW757_06470 [Anaerolineales bacterium]|nr:hypothetical protein [Anaerolineales bacterium]
MIRKLGSFEKAALLTNRHAPFNIVSVLIMENAPSPDAVRQVFAKLQIRHPLLHARITKKGRALVFEDREKGEFHFEVVERDDAEQWRTFAEREMAYRYDDQIGPLFRVVYLYADGRGDLLLNLHHVIADADSGMNLLDEFLQLSAGAALDLAPLPVSPPPEDHFPERYKGIRRVLNISQFAIAQMGEMFAYNWQTRKERTPPVRSGSMGKIAAVILPEDLVNQLARIGRSKGITLNSLLNAAQVLAVNHHLYASKPLPMRTFSFASLRPYTNPPTSNRDLGSFVSMLVYTIEVLPDDHFWGLAARLHQKIFRSLKSGDKFSAFLMSESLMKLFIRLKSMRMGTTALNYAGNVTLEKTYGAIQVLGLHGFISGIDLAPEFSSQARLFDNQLWWDFIYLDTDMQAETALAIIDEIIRILEQAV